MEMKNKMYEIPEKHVAMGQRKSYIYEHRLLSPPQNATRADTMRYT